jgi:O-antigen/teichoic acid export membrane protein
MKNMLRIISLLLIAVGALMLSQRPAYAYTDPGTGLLAIQAAGSALIATGWYLRRKIYSLFHRKAAVEQSLEHLLVRKDETSSLS